MITNITNTGTDVTLQANNDIRITTSELVTNNPEGNGGNITLQAGRSVDVNANIVSDGGDITIIANETASNGTQFNFRDPGIADITISDDILLDAGTGDVTLIIRDGGGDLGNVDVDSIVGDNVTLSTGAGTINVDGTISGIDNSPSSSITLQGTEINVDNPEEQLISDNVTITEAEIIIPDQEFTSDVPNLEVPEEMTAREEESEIPLTLGNIAFEGSAGDDNSLVSLLPIIDADFARGYENYYNPSSFGRRSREDGLQVNLPQVKQNLKRVEEATGAKPALIYVAFFPAGVDAIAGRGSNILPQADDQLELIAITEAGEPIRKPIKGVTRAKVNQIARRFAFSIFDQQPERLFLPLAQQLHQWIVEPLKAELDAQEINNLVFLMDSGLRTVPIAALHDGEQYLVQKYSVGLMPSLSLTDTRYKNVSDLGLLAMGSETFPDPELSDLPAVPVEVDIITQQLWSGGRSFLGESFTIDNLKQTQASSPFGILHLATHAEFSPGTPNNSFIQFGDRKLELDKVRELGLSNPQVELMVLSACKTAFGDPDAEYGFAGLAHQAGVKSALGSLWYVNDQGTLSIMSKFYQELKDAPIKAEALRRAQVAMIEQQVRLEPGKLITTNQTFDLPPDIEVVDMTHPRYWSSFTIIGNPW